MEFNTSSEPTLPQVSDCYPQQQQQQQQQQVSPSTTVVTPVSTPTLPQVSQVPLVQVALSLPQQPEMNSQGNPIVVKTLSTTLKPLPRKRNRRKGVKQNTKRGRPPLPKTLVQRSLKAQGEKKKKSGLGEGEAGEEKKPKQRNQNMAYGKRARNAVFRGAKKMTTYGMKKEEMRRNRHGKIVSIKASESAKKRFGNKGIGMFVDAVREAKRELNIKGFQAVGGKSERGQLLLQKARSIYKREKERREQLKSEEEKNQEQLKPVSSEQPVSVGAGTGQ